MSLFIKRFVASLVGVILFVMGFNYVMDPLAYYRIPKLYEPQYTTNARYQLPGLLRNLSYDTLIVGTSMSRNFIESELDEAWNVKSFNAAIPSSTAREQVLSFELAVRSRPELQDVFWELNFYSLAREPLDVEDEQGEFPYYLWDKSPWNDYRYLFSLYPMQRLRETAFANLRNDTAHRDLEMLFKYGLNASPLTEEEVRELVDIPSSVTQSLYQYDMMLTNFRENIVPLVQEHPEVEFTFYFPPYAIFWHVRAHKQNIEYLDSITRLKSTIYDELSAYDNVRIYDFQDRTEITHTIVNYVDVAHFVPAVNRWLIEAVQQQAPLASLEEASTRAESLKRQVLEYEMP